MAYLTTEAVLFYFRFLELDLLLTHCMILLESVDCDFPSRMQAFL